jgi:hypothetical protein
MRKKKWSNYHVHYIQQIVRRDKRPGIVSFGEWSVGSAVAWYQSPLLWVGKQSVECAVVPQLRPGVLNRDSAEFLVRTC